MSGADKTLNAREAAVLLGGHVETVRRLARAGKLPAFKLGKDWRFRESVLRQWSDGHATGGRQKSILCVDDDADVLSFVARALGRAGYSVQTASTGEEGLRGLLTGTPDLLILDLHMPGINGPELLRRAHRGGRLPPFIILTSHPDGDLMAQTLAFSPFTVLAKPVHPQRLVETVSRILTTEDDVPVRE